MTTITIDNQSYELESLTDEAKAQLGSLQFVDSEIGQLQARLAAMQTARMAYARALSEALPKASEDTIKFS
jgi:Family of unknown function (DUF6447)